MRRSVAWLTFALGAASCADITLPERGLCGNGVLETGEDCDGHADARLGSSLSCRSCAYSCAGGAECPTGWHCDGNQQCHHAVARFEAAPRSPFDLGSNEVLIGDVDGDTKTDVAAFVGAGLVIRFGAGDGSLDAVATHRLPVSLSGRLGVGDVSGDGRLDAVIPTRFGLGVVIGRSDRTMDPVAYSSFFMPADWQGAWVLPVRVPGVAPEQSLALLWRDPDTRVKLGLVVWDNGAQQDAIFDGIDGVGTELLGTRIPVVNLDADPAADEIVLAFAGETRVHVCTIDDFRFFGCATSSCPHVVCSPLDLPQGYRIVRREGDPGADSATRVADVDGDGRLDLLVHAEANGSDHVLVAPGNGTVELGPLAVDSRFGPSWPLLAAELGGDPAADYVMPDGLHLATGADHRLERVSAALSTETWIEAVAGDFDRDGDQDVFLAKVLEGSWMIELRRGGVREPRFPPEPSWPLFGRAELLRVGDFDDDGVDDLAFVERATASDSDVLRLLWGSRDGSPQGAADVFQPDRVARFPRIDHLEPGILRATSGDLDRASDLLVNVSVPEPGVGAFGGSPLLRSMRSPFVLQVATNSPDQPSDAFVGEFTEEDGGPGNLLDLLVFARSSDGARRLWLVPGADAARFAAAGAPPAPGRRPARVFDVAPPAESPFDDQCAEFGVHDIDADGIDELVGIDCGTPDRASTLLIARAPSGSIETCFVPLPDIRGVRDLASVDFDGDQRSELVVADETGVWLFSDVPRLCETPGDPPHADVLAVRGEPAKSLTVLDIDSDATPELAILDDSGIYFMEIDASGGRIADPPSIEPGVVAERIITDDFNGDGLDDLLWSNGLQAGVLLAKSHRGGAAQ